MSIWGSIFGGIIGFSLGGPLGALLGSFVGNKISSTRNSRKYNKFQNNQQVFALSLIILSAKLSKVDGHVSKEELNAIREKLNIPENEIDQVSKIFNKAKEEPHSFEPYAKQISEIYFNNKNLLEEVVNILFYIAESDGTVSSAELKMIKKIAFIFGLSDFQFKSILESRKSDGELNPYIVLGSLPDDSLNEIRKKYIKLSKANHPDLLISKGLPEEVINESKKKMRAINSAWDKVQKLRAN